MSDAKTVDAGAGLLRQLFGGGDDAASSSAKSVAKSVTGTRPTATTRAAGSEETVSTAAGILQQLVMSDNPRDIQLLRDMASSMPPERFNALLVRSFRDPKSPANAPVLNHIGQEILNVSGGAEPSLTKTADSLGDTGVAAVDIEGATDLPEKAAPHRPKHEGKIIRPSDDARFHTKEGYRTNKDGTTEVLTPKFDEETGKLTKGTGGSGSLDKQTAAAAVKAARGDTPNPISDVVAMKNSKPQQQSYNENLTRLLGLINPQGVKAGRSSGGVPGSALSGTGGIKRRSANSIGKTTAGDYETISQLLGDLGVPVSLDGTTARELATKIIAGADQSMFNATPLTAGQRQGMMGAAEMLSGNPKTSEPALRAFYPKESAGGTMPGRQASVQQASIDTLTRKIEELLSTESTDIGDIASAPSIDLNATKLGGPRKVTGGEVPKPDLSPKIRESQQVQGPAELGDELPVPRQLDDAGKPYTNEKPEPVGERRVDNSGLGYQDKDGPDEFSKTGLRTSKAGQLGRMEGREITARRPVDIQADIESATDPRVIAQLREELKDSLSVSEMLPKEFKMAATNEGPVPKSAQYIETAEEAAARNAKAKQLKAEQSTAALGQVTPRQTRAEKAAAVLGQPGDAVKSSAPKTPEDRIRQIDEARRNDTNKRTEIGTENESIFSKYIPHALIARGSLAGYTAYQSNKSNPDAVEDTGSNGSGLSRRERMRAARQTGGQP